MPPKQAANQVASQVANQAATQAANQAANPTANQWTFIYAGNKHVDVRSIIADCPLIGEPGQPKMFPESKLGAEAYRIHLRRRLRTFKDRSNLEVRGQATGITGGEGELRLCYQNLIMLSNCTLYNNSETTPMTRQNATSQWRAADAGLQRFDNDRRHPTQNIDLQPHLRNLCVIYERMTGQLFEGDTGW